MDFRNREAVKRPYSDVMPSHYDENKENIMPLADSKRFKMSQMSPGSSSSSIDSTLIGEMAKTTFMLSKQLKELHSRLNSGASTYETPLSASFASSGYNSSSSSTGSSFIGNSTMNDSIQSSAERQPSNLSSFETKDRRYVLGEIPQFKLDQDDHHGPRSGGKRMVYMTPRCQAFPTNKSPPRINRALKTAFNHSLIESSASPETTNRNIVKRICF